MPIPLPSKTKDAIKRQRHRLRRRFVRWRHPFGPDDLRRSLRELGLRRGDVVLVHSSFDAFESFTGKPTDVIGALQDLVGSTGTLLMPTLPFSGTAVEWARQGRVFDVRRTASTTGLIAELFRRTPGVERSVHPTHSVAAWGNRATALLADHHLATTPCGAGTPYTRLLDHAGRILFLGTGIDPMTFYHAVEEILEPAMPFSPFTKESYRLTSRTADGTVVETTTRLFDPAVSRRRNLDPLVPVLRRRGTWRSARVGTCEAILLDAKDVVDALREMAAAGQYCYE